MAWTLLSDICFQHGTLKEYSRSARKQRRKDGFESPHPFPWGLISLPGETACSVLSRLWAGLASLRPEPQDHPPGPCAASGVLTPLSCSPWSERVPWPPADSPPLPHVTDSAGTLYFIVRATMVINSLLVQL